MIYKGLIYNCCRIWKMGCDMYDFGNIDYTYDIFTEYTFSDIKNMSVT